MKGKYEMKHELPQLAIDFMNYLKTNDKSEVTILSYEQELHDLFIFLIDYKKYKGSITDISIDFIKSITIMDLNAFIAHLTESVARSGKKYSPASIAKYVACIKSFFTIIITQFMLKIDNPSQYLKSPKKPESLPKFLTREQVQRLFDAVCSERNYERNIAIIKVFVNTGLRLSELANIKFSDINDNQLTVIGKGKKERMVFLNDVCLTSIYSYMAVRPITDCDKLFVRNYSEKCKELTGAGIRQMIMGYAKKAGLPSWFTPHKLRHTFATEALSKGVKMETIRDVLGHKRIATTEIYAKVVNESRKELAQIVSF